VGILSNFLGLRDARPDERTALIRPAAAEEVEAALRLVLVGPGGSGVTEQQVQDFIGFARDRGIDLELLWVAEEQGKLAYAALPVVSPGKTMLLFVSHPAGRGSEGTIARLIEAVCDAAAGRGVELAQALIDPQEEAMRRVYTAAGFEAMAELIYLQGTPHADAAPPALPPHFRWIHYSAEVHEQFAQTVLASYRQSLDCPALNGLRHIDDVLDGHKASGVFDPKHWFVLLEADRPVGVLLLASSGREQGLMELVYLGLPPEARGRKLGELLVRQAMAVVASEGHQRLSLAVDAKNIPALKLYYRHGMNRIASKLAMMRDLRKTGVGYRLSE
jgi:GNAT superfamily N-acetyltransferase